MGALPVDDIVGAARMTPDAQDQVVTILRGLPVSLLLRRGFYHRWLSIVDLPITPGELDRVAPLPGQRRGTRG